MNEFENYVKWFIDNWDVKNFDDFPTVEGFDCVEVVRKTRDMTYKEGHGLPYEEEKAYLEKTDRNCDEQIGAFLKKRRELVCA